MVKLAKRKVMFLKNTLDRLQVKFLGQVKHG